MASALAGNSGGYRADIRRPDLRVSFERFPAGAELEQRGWEEPEYAGVYRLMSVNGARPPFYWRSGTAQGASLSEWLISGRAFVKEDRTWVIRLASGPVRSSMGEGHITLLQGSWAPAMPGQLAVRTAGGSAASWLANGRSLLIRGCIAPPDAGADLVSVTLRFARWR